MYINIKEIKIRLKRNYLCFSLKHIYHIKKSINYNIQVVWINLLSV